MSNKSIILSLKKLVNTMAVSGYEWELGIAQRIQSLIGKKGERIGDNLIYKIGSGKKKIMLIAHMDEVGFIISQVKNNYCRIIPIGDISASEVVGGKLVFMSQEKQILSQEINPANSFKEIKVKGLPGKIGDIGTFEKSFTYSKNNVLSPSLDNKVGCLALIETLKNLKKRKLNASVYICFAPREEVSMNGCMSAVRKINPDLCIDVDSAYAQPIKGVENWSIPAIGKGPALQLMGTDFIIRASNRRLVEKISSKAKIKFQYEIPEGKNGGTNASSLMNAGYDVIQINIPVSRQHSAKSKVSMKDIDETILLLHFMLIS